MMIGTRSLWLAAVAVLGVGAVEKRWLVDVDWSSRANWAGGVEPGPDSRVVLPVGMRLSLAMPRNHNTRFAGLQLARDGLLALPLDGKLEMSEQPLGVATWVKEGPFFWVDPANWAGASEAAPHLERLPCQNDEVVLPASSKAFSMWLPGTRDVEVRNVRLADQNYTLPRWEWRQATRRSEFSTYGHTVRYSPVAGCDNCHCQEGDLSEYSEEICNVQWPRCGLVACEYPLKVEGHCCFYCGGRIRLSRKSLPSTVGRVAKSVLNTYDGAVLWHSRPTWDGYYEVLITEKGIYDGTNTQTAISDLESALRDEGLEVLSSETSGGPLYDYRLLMALAPFLGALVALLLFVLILCPIFGYSFSQVLDACGEFGSAVWGGSASNSGREKKSYAFARFENLPEGNVQLAESAVQRPQKPSGERFENPLYRLSRPSLEQTTLNLDQPVSVGLSLDKPIELDRMDNVGMDIEDL